MLNLANQPARTITKEQQLFKKRQKPTQKQMGDISANVRKAVRERSGGVCEVRKRCDGATAAEMAHITGRKQISHRTTAEDLLDSCIDCHRWLDGTVEGIKFKKGLRENG